MAFRDFFAHCTSKDKALSDFIKNDFGFYPKNITLYQLAFTHKSASDNSLGNFKLNNERLEYLGPEQKAFSPKCAHASSVEPR